MIRTWILALCLAVSGWAQALPLAANGVSVGEQSAIVHTSADRMRIERWLANPRLRSPLDFARQMRGLPYVAHTLEGHEPEQLVVNTRELDCATLVETASALARTRALGKRSFADFATQLRLLRYFDGRIEGYTSRLHYLSFWMAHLVERGRIAEVQLAPRLTEPLYIQLRYMSTHPESYEHLTNHPDRVARIAELERKYSGHVGRFLPKHRTQLSRAQLGAIRDGDIIAIVTSRAGLDYSHQGIAYWGKDGRLHMLHASSERGRVIEDERTLYDYLARIKHARGIRVFRLK